MRAAALLLAPLLAACATVATRHPLTVDPSTLPPPGIPAHEIAWPGPEADSAARALGWQPLRTANLPPGTQEIRIWIGGGMGAESDLLRVTRHGDSVSGGAARYWSVRQGGHYTLPVPFDSLIRYSERGYCQPFLRRGYTEACTRRFTRTPDWSVLWDSLVTLGAWRLPDESQMPSDSVFVSDGYIMTVELRDGSYYRRYSYANPDFRRAAERRAAAAVARVPWLVDSLSTPRSSQVTRRGDLAIGSLRSELVTCDGKERWVVEGLYSPDSLRQIPPTIPASDSVARRHFVATVTGLAVLPEVARLWAPEFTGELEAASARDVKPWRGRCD
ncbi:MAG: hypothetical protein ACREL5_12695 [Gemmatimonadales bacterium]